MDARVRHQVGLELVDVHVQRAAEAQRGGHGGNHLRDQSVQVGVGRSLDAEVVAADVVDGLVVEHHGKLRVLQQVVGAEHGVVGLHHGGAEEGRRIDREAELGLLAVVQRQSLEQQRTETRTGTSAHRVEDEEALNRVAGVSHLAETVHHDVDVLLADGVVTASVVVGGVFLSRNQLLGVVQVLAGTVAELVDHGGLQINEDGTGNQLARVRLVEEGAVVLVLVVLVHLVTLGIDAVFQTEQLPAIATKLNTSLTNMHRYDFTHSLKLLTPEGQRRHSRKNIVRNPPRKAPRRNPRLKPAGPPHNTPYSPCNHPRPASIVEVGGKSEGFSYCTHRLHTPIEY